MVHPKHLSSGGQVGLKKRFDHVREGTVNLVMRVKLTSSLKIRALNLK